MKTKICNRCKADLPVDSDNWYFYTSPLTDIRHPKSICKECEKARVNKHYHDNYIPKPRVPKPPKPKPVKVKQKPGRKTQILGDTKICTKCKNEYPSTTDYFMKDNRGAGGLMSICKACKREVKREYAKNNPDAIKAQKKRSHERNRDHNNARTRKWIVENPDKLKESKKRYYENNKEAFFNRANERIHRRRANGGSFTQSEIEQLYIDQQGLCAYCKGDISNGYHKDHIQPVSKGGSNNIDNIALACTRCNLSKHDKTPSEWVNRWYIA